MLQSHRFVALLTTLMLLATLVLSTPASAQEADAAWNALPSETLLAARIPNGQAIVDAMRKQTKFGQVVFKGDRFDKALELMKKEAPEEWEKMNADMAKYGFAPADMAQVMTGQSAFAFVMESRADAAADAAPLMVALMWAEPGEDLATRIMSAIDKAMLDQPAEGEGKVVRVDYELGGHKVVQMTWGLFQKQTDGIQMDWPENFGEMTPEQRQEFFENQRKKMDAAPVVEMDQTHLMVTKEGGRIYLAMTFPQSQAEVFKQRAAGQEKIDFAAVTGLEQAKAVMARFLAAKDANQAGGFLARVTASPGLLDAMPKGMTLIELYGDLTAALKLADKAANPEVARSFKALGVDSLTTMAAGFTLDGNFLRSGAFVTLPAPRRGLMTLLEQPELPADVPAWVPADVTQYTHFSFELGKAYLTIKQLMIDTFGEEAGQGFMMAEGQAQMMLQVALPDLLASVGGKHTLVAYAPRMVKPKPFQLPGMPAAEAPEADAVEMPPVPVNRQAFVWQLANADVWAKMMTVIGNMTQGQGPDGPVKAAQEQGFTGYRITDQFSGQESSLFLGKGYLVYASGPDVVENILASLNSAPEGDKALAGSAIAARARQIMTPRPGLMYQIMDADKVARNGFDTMMKGIEFGLENATERVDGPDPVAMLEGLKALLPTPEEVEGILGVSTGQAYLTEQGVVNVGVVELPAP